MSIYKEQHIKMRKVSGLRHPTPEIPQEELPASGVNPGETVPPALKTKTGSKGFTLRAESKLKIYKTIHSLTSCLEDQSLDSLTLSMKLLDAAARLAALACVISNEEKQSYVTPVDIFNEVKKRIDHVPDSRIYSPVQTGAGYTPVNYAHVAHYVPTSNYGSMPGP